MKLVSQLLARACHSTGSFNAGLLCNGISSAAMTAIEKGGIVAGLAVLGLTPATWVPAACVLALLGGTAAFRAICIAKKEKELDERFKAIDTQGKNTEQIVMAMREAIDATGVRIHPEDVLDLRSFFEAQRTQDLTKLSDRTAHQLIAVLDEAGLATADQIKEVEGYAKQTWLRSLHIWEQQRADAAWLRECETRLTAKLDAIKADTTAMCDTQLEQVKMLGTIIESLNRLGVGPVARSTLSNAPVATGVQSAIESQDWDKADKELEALRASPALDPAYDYYTLMGDRHFGENRFDLALPYYEQAMSLRPDVVNARINLALALTSAGRGECQAQLRRAIELLQSALLINYISQTNRKMIKNILNNAQALLRSSAGKKLEISSEDAHGI